LLSISLLKVILKGLEQLTPKSWSACDVCEGKVIISNPNSLIHSIALKVSWDPCPSKMNKCLFVRDIPLGLTSWKKIKNPWKSK
jgi:hypothetical protein